MKALFLVLLALISSVCLGARKIYDPLNVFCGEESCYDILGVPKDAKPRELKKAYRKLASTHHPDKNKAADATIIFRKIAKAYEVLENNKSRESFDYYLKNPTDYFKVSGEHYFRALPKANIYTVIIGLLVLLSIFLHVVQNNKYSRAIRFLKDRVSRGATEMNGGTRQTVVLFAQAQEKYIEILEGLKSNAESSAAASTSTAIQRSGSGDLGGLSKKQMKNVARNKNGGISVKRDAMLADPAFQEIVTKLIETTKIEGEYAKPELRNLFILRVLMLPYSLYQWAVKYHRRYISKAELSLEEKTEMAIETVGIATWDELSPIQRTQCIDMGVWDSNVYDKWITDRDRVLKRKGKREDDGDHFD